MREPKKKVLKPPGYKKPPLPKARPKAEAGGEADEAGPSGGTAGTAGKMKQQQRRGSIGPDDFSQERRAVRDSTRQKVEEGELERKLAEKVRGRWPGGLGCMGQDCCVAVCANRCLLLPACPHLQPHTVHTSRPYP